MKGGTGMAGLIDVLRDITITIVGTTALTRCLVRVVTPITNEDVMTRFLTMITQIFRRLITGNMPLTNTNKASTVLT